MARFLSSMIYFQVWHLTSSSPNQELIPAVSAWSQLQHTPGICKRFHVKSPCASHAASRAPRKNRERRILLPESIF